MINLVNKNRILSCLLQIFWFELEDSLPNILVFSTSRPSREPYGTGLWRAKPLPTQQEFGESEKQRIRPLGRICKDAMQGFWKSGGEFGPEARLDGGAGKGRCKVRQPWLTAVWIVYS